MRRLNTTGRGIGSPNRRLRTLARRRAASADSPGGPRGSGVPRGVGRLEDHLRESLANVHAFGRGWRAICCAVGDRPSTRKTVGQHDLVL